MGPARRAGDKDVDDVNVTATVRTLSVDGGPIKDEEWEVNVAGKELFSSNESGSLTFSGRAARQ